MRRRENPYQGDVYTIPLISREQNRDLLLLLTEGVVHSGEAEFARKNLLMPVIDNLKQIIDDYMVTALELHDDPMLPFKDMKSQAEVTLAEALVSMLESVNKRIMQEQRAIGKNPRRRMRLKRYY